MKKTIVTALLALTVLTGAFASFEGHTSIAPSYAFNDGGNYIGLSSDTFGYINDCPVGYYAGVNAAFNVQNLGSWRIGIIAGPAYSYNFGESGVKLDLGAGLSLGGTQDVFAFGLGGYVGASWQMSEVFGLGVGTTIGSNFVTVSLKNGDFGIEPDFFVSPRLSAIFYY